MPVIVLQTEIDAPAEVCFDLSRSIDLHMHCAAHTGETAIAGVKTGLIELGEEVTWRAKHFGVWQTLTSRITQFDRPRHFRDSLVRGVFRRFDHDHHFQVCDNGRTLMIDTFDYNSPLGLLGNIADRIFLEKYMRGFLAGRNLQIKSIAESSDWQRFIVS